MTLSGLGLAFPFVHPGLATAALLLGAMPLLVHLINRRRYLRMPWAAMAFLLAARKKSAARVRLEQWLLLLARTAVIVGFGLAVARPYSPASALLPLPASRSHRIVLLDDSLSMSARNADGSTSFQRARAYADELMGSFPEHDPVSVLTMSAPAEPVAVASFDRRYVRERLTATAPSQRAASAADVAEATLEVLQRREVAPGNQFVYFICDLQRNDWSSTSPQVPTPAVSALRRLADALSDPRAGSDSSEQFTVVATAPDQAENAAIVSLSVASTLVGVGVPVTVLAEITNFGSSAVRGATLEVRREGRLARREELAAIGPRASTTAQVTVEFAEEGTHGLEARLLTADSDALPEDNIRYLSVEVRKSTQVLLVDGRPGTTRLAGNAGFLATALDPRMSDSVRMRPTRLEMRPSEPSLIEPKIITESELSGELLSDFAVIALCNVAGLPAEQWQQVARFVSEGGGLMVFAGDRVNSENYNRFGYASGSGPLPGTLGEATAAAPSGKPSSEMEDHDSYVGFKSEPFTHPILADFTGHAASGLFLAQVQRYLPIQADPRRSELLLRYTNGQPALIASRYGEGNVLLFTTTANLDWTNLPAKGDFVSLMLHAIGYVSPRRGGHRNLEVGQTLREPVTAVQSSLPRLLTLPDGSAVRPTMVPSADSPPRAGSLVIQHGPLDRVGVYSLAIGTETRRVAVNTDPKESDLTSVSELQFREALDRPIRFLATPTSGAVVSSRPKRTELARLTLYIVAGLLVLEMALAMLFNRQPSSASRDSSIPSGPHAGSGMLPWRNSLSGS